MKKIFGIILCVLLIFLCAFALADVEINAASFPDKNFREYVRQFDTDGNGSFSDLLFSVLDRKTKEEPEFLLSSDDEFDICGWIRREFLR